MTVFKLKIEEEKCWGCKTCEVACKQENRKPDGVRLIRVSEEGPKTVNGKPTFHFRVNRCRHCENPPCAAVCPVDAIEKRADTVVVLDKTLCMGCKACLEACPFNAIDYEEGPGFAVKCNLCHHRLDKGLLPACADNVCLAHCINLVVE